MIQGSRVSLRALFAFLIVSGPIATCHAGLTTPNGNPTGDSIAFSAVVPGGSASLAPVSAGYVGYSGDMYLNAALDAQRFTASNGWIFVAGSMTGNIQLDRYYAWADTRPGFTDGGITVKPGSDPGSGGCVIALTYVPGVGDPTGDNIHWVQVIRTNLPTDFGMANGTTMPGDPGFTYYIDDGYGPGVPGNPYYDSGYSADDTTFIDRPGRPIPEDAIWNAEVFLVDDNTFDQNGKTFHVESVLGGVYYGFTTAVPEPSSAILTVIALGSIALVQLRRKALRPAA